jgi:membrane protein
MPQSHDFTHAVRKEGFWVFLKNVWNETNTDNLFTWASATAYSWLFAIFPFFLMLMALVPYLPAAWKSSAKHWTQWAVYQLPNTAAETIWANIGPKVDQLLNHPPAGLFSIGLVVTIWSASGGMNATISALDKCYDVKNPRSFVRQRLLAIGLTAIVAVMILAVLILMPIGTLVTSLLQWWLTKHHHLQHFLPFLMIWQILRYVLALGLLFGVVAIVYYYGPRVRPRRQSIIPGTVFCVAIWILLGIVFRIYIDRFGRYNETYGTVGGVAVLLFLFYVDSLVLLIGAELNAQVDRTLAKEPQGSALEKETPG